MKIIFLLLITTTALAQRPSAFDCDFYQELETRMGCGPQGYPLSFGKRLCEKYLQAETFQGPSLREWFPQVRYCLQEFLAENAHKYADCTGLKEAAMNSHISCYVETGFCSLGRSDLSALFRITGRDLLKSDVALLGLRVSRECRRQ